MDRPLRIAFLDSWKPTSFDGSGTAVGIRNLASGLALLGHLVHMVRPRGGNLGVLRRIGFNLVLPRRLRAEPKFDLIVGFDIDGFRWTSVRDSATPYAVSLKGIAADEARFSRSYAERTALTTLARLEKRNALGADRVFVPSRYSAGVAERMYGLPPGRVRVVPEAVDLAPWRVVRATRAERHTPPRTPTILSVARQYPRKDTATLLRAMPPVLEAFPTARLRVVGGGPELPPLRRLAASLGLGDSVRWEGELSDDAAVREAFLDADVFCLPSLQEGFGIAFVEAMGAGLPIVAARAGAVPEVVEDGRTGLLVPPADPAAVARALSRLLGDTGARLRMGAEGARQAERFDLKRVAEQFASAAREISSRPGS